MKASLKAAHAVQSCAIHQGKTIGIDGVTVELRTRGLTVVRVHMRRIREYRIDAAIDTGKVRAEATRSARYVEYAKVTPDTDIADCQGGIRTRHGCQRRSGYAGGRPIRGE